MESALTRQALTPVPEQTDGGGRRLAALLLFLGALALGLALGCGRGGAPKAVGRWRIGLGAAGMSLDPSGERLAVVCRRSNDVWLLRLSDGAFQARIDTLPKPRAVFFHPDSLSYFVAEGLSSVAQVRLSDRRVARRFRPRWRIGAFAFDPLSRRLFCGHVGVPSLGVYRLKDMHLETTVAVGGEVQAVCFDGKEAWVATRQADALLKVSLTDMSVKAASTAGPDPRGLALDTAQGLAYVPCHGRAGEADALVLPTPSPTAEELSPMSGTAEAGEGDGEAAPAALEADDEADAPQALADEHRYDGSGVAVIRLEDVRRVDFLEVPGGPVAAVLSGSGERLALACEDGSLRIVDLPSRRVVQSLALGARPGAMLAGPDGRHLYVALATDKAVLKILPGAGWR